MFLDWKRKLSKLQTKLPNLPPFEKNLDFWRQLWKIVELSDVVVQVRVTDLKYSPIGTRERAPTACMTWQMSADIFPKLSYILEESVFDLTGRKNVSQNVLPIVRQGCIFDALTFCCTALFRVVVNISVV